MAPLAFRWFGKVEKLRKWVELPSFPLSRKAMSSSQPLRYLAISRYQEAEFSRFRKVNTIPDEEYEVCSRPFWKFGD